MPSSYSSRLRLEKQATGENTDNWGVLLNTLIDLIDSSIAGMATVAVTGGAYSLTANNSVADESRMAILKFTGVLASNSVITVPTQSKLYTVWNATSGAYTLTLKTAAGSGVAVAQGKKGMLLCDGTNVLEAFDSLAGNLAIVGTLAAGPTTITGALSATGTVKSNSRTVALELIAASSASASAVVDFTTGIDSTYDEYLVTFTDIVPATNDADLLLRVSQDAGSTFKSGATDYADSASSVVDITGANYGSTGRASIRLTQEIDSGGAVSGQVRFYGPSGTALKKKFVFSVTGDQGTGGIIRTSNGGGMLTLNTSAINGIRFLMSSGNITSGNFALYGVRKS